MYSRLALNSSTSQVLGLRVYTTMALWVLFSAIHCIFSISLSFCFTHGGYFGLYQCSIITATLTSPLSPGPVHSLNSTAVKSPDGIGVILQSASSAPPTGIHHHHRLITDSVGWTSWPTYRLSSRECSFIPALSNVTVMLHSFSGCFNSPERGPPSLACFAVSGGRRKGKGAGSEALYSVLGCPVFRM